MSHCIEKVSAIQWFHLIQIVGPSIKLLIVFWWGGRGWTFLNLKYLKNK